MQIAGPPNPGHPVPIAMARLAGAAVRLVWKNGVGGLTGSVEGPDPRFIKWNPSGSGESLAAEATRLRWISGRHPAPEVLDYVVEDGAELLVTRTLPGVSAVDPQFQATPNLAIRGIARGLKALHELPVQDCPFNWGVSARVATALAGDTARQLATKAPSIDRLVVCQGDPCAPNTLLRPDGRFLASVDLGSLGVADRWADLAVATLSLAWNFTDFDEEVFWDEYGVAPDAQRIGYYRDLWNAS